jgi:hypothetical protein
MPMQSLLYSHDALLGVVFQAGCKCRFIFSDDETLRSAEILCSSFILICKDILTEHLRNLF